MQCCCNTRWIQTLNYLIELEVLLTPRVQKQKNNPNNLVDVIISTIIGCPLNIRVNIRKTAEKRWNEFVLKLITQGTSSLGMECLEISQNTNKTDIWACVQGATGQCIIKYFQIKNILLKYTLSIYSSYCLLKINYPMSSVLLMNRQTVKPSLVKKVQRAARLKED